MVGSPAVLLQMAWESVIVLWLGKNGAAIWSLRTCSLKISRNWNCLCSKGFFALLAILNFQMIEESRRI